MTVYEWEHGRVDSAKVIEVIEVKYTKGEGVAGDPVRRASAYFATCGTRLFDKDYDDD